MAVMQTGPSEEGSYQQWHSGVLCTSLLLCCEYVVHCAMRWAVVFHRTTGGALLTCEAVNTNTVWPFSAPRSHVRMLVRPEWLVKSVMIVGHAVSVVGVE